MKIFGILVCMLLIITLLPASALSEGYENSDVIAIFNGKSNIAKETTADENNGKGEELDQSQTGTNQWGWFVSSWQWIAQGFTPTLDTLTKVELYLFKNGNPSSNILFTVSIKDDLYSEIDLAIISKDVSDLPPQGAWIEFDFNDINVTPEQKYYIVSKSNTDDHYNCYCWYSDINDPYTRGDGWGDYYFTF